MKNLTRKITALIMASFFLVTGCSSSSGKTRSDNEDEFNGEFNSSIDYSSLERCSYDEEACSDDYNAYSLELIRQVLNNESSSTNVMVSPASVMFALDMCSAGANGDTLRQIIDLFAPGEDPLSQHAFASQMLDRINNSDGVEFNAANAIWTNSDRMSSGLNPDFQNYIEEYFDAQATFEPFSSDTVDEINGWVDDQTNGMIDGILDNLPNSTISVIVNAIAFEGQWAVPYEDYQVTDMPFTTSSGTEENVSMLNSEEGTYFETSEATGFLKAYEGGQYAFMAILPSDESISANEFLMDFSGEDYQEFIESLTYDYEVYTRIPEFTYDYNVNLNRVLQAMGMEDSFDEDRADFSGIGIPDSGTNLFIDLVIHKTHIELDREGTRAAAATAVLVCDSCALPDENNVRYVYCDRPFAYAIVDTETMNPLFIGTYNG